MNRSGVDAGVLERYDKKYDWRYDVDEYGLLTEIAPMTVLANLRRKMLARSGNSRATRDWRRTPSLWCNAGDV